MHQPKKIISGKIDYKNPLYTVRKDLFVKHNKKQGTYYSIITEPFVVICALTADKKGVYIVRSWRYPLKRFLWEFPKGWREKNETPLMTAKREMGEELGLVARRWKSLGWFYLAPGITNQRGYIFIAEGLQRIINNQKNEEIVEQKVISISQLYRMIRTKNKFIDCASITAFHKILEYLS